MPPSIIISKLIVLFFIFKGLLMTYLAHGKYTALFYLFSHEYSTMKYTILQSIVSMSACRGPHQASSLAKAQPFC